MPVRCLDNRLIDTRCVHQLRLRSGRVRLRGGGLRVLLCAVRDEDEREARGRDFHLADALRGVALHGLDLLLALQTAVSGPVIGGERLEKTWSG